MSVLIISFFRFFNFFHLFSFPKIDRAGAGGGGTSYNGLYGDFLFGDLFIIRASCESM